MSKRAECIVFANHKGGTGKTTSCLSIAGFLARSGSKVLIVDLDPQANASAGLGVDPITVKRSMYDALLTQADGRHGVPLTQVIVTTKVKNLHLAPAELDLAAAEVVMQQSDRRAFLLRDAIEEVRSYYDFILIDVPPSSGLLMVNALCASDQVIVPVDPSRYALEALDNLKIFFRDTKRLAGHNINQITLLLVRYQQPGLVGRLMGRRQPAQEVEERLRGSYTVYTIPDSDEIYRAQQEELPLSHVAPESDVGRAYERIARSLKSDRVAEPERVAE